MIQVIKFQSKPNKARKYEYTLQKNGMYKSNGNQGNKFSSAYFNHLNPVLEVKKDNTVIKIGMTLPGIGKIDRINLTDNKQDVIIYLTIGGSRLLSALEVKSTPVVAEKPKAPEVKPFDVAAAKEYVKENYRLQDSEDNNTQQPLPTCCGLIEVGNFPEDKIFEIDIEENIVDYILKSFYKDKQPLKKDITAISKDKEFISELIVNELEKELNLKESFIAVLNNKKQSYVLSAFEKMSSDDKYKGTFDMIEFKSNSSGNKLTLITYTIG